jgi:hypothetical protein
MRERLITLLCALGALVLFFTMFVQGGSGAGRSEIPRPTTANRDANGYRAALEWLNKEHIRAVSLRDRFDRLAQGADVAPTGNVLIVTLPTKTSFKTEEIRALDKWVREGNALLVLAALSDNPDWAHASGGMVSGDLNLLTGLQFETVRNHERTLRRAALVANRPHAYFEGVREGLALSDYPSQPWVVKVPYDGFVFSLAHQGETGESVLWTRTSGNGSIVVSGLGSIFTNRAIGLADNGRLLANLVGVNLGPHGTVLFDDVHQGLGAVYDPSMFYQDRRLYVTAAIVSLLWLSWVLGATKLRAPVSRIVAPREAELIRATGGFLARVLTPASAARRMFDHFLRRYSWDALDRHSRLAAVDVRQLKSWHADAGAARSVPLVRLHNLMVKIDRQLNS